MLSETYTEDLICRNERKKNQVLGFDTIAVTNHQISGFINKCTAELHSRVHGVRSDIKDDTVIGKETAEGDERSCGVRTSLFVVTLLLYMGIYQLDTL